MPIINFEGHTLDKSKKLFSISGFTYFTCFEAARKHVKYGNDLYVYLEDIDSKQYVKFASMTFTDLQNPVSRLAQLDVLRDLYTEVIH